jgi:hypothetical protein
MVNCEGSAVSSLTTAPDAASRVDPADFDARWATWVARGRVHERRVRRRFVIWAGVFATGVAVAYAFLHS